MDRSKKYVFGNWKMNGTNKDIKKFFKEAKKNYNNTVVAGLAVPYTDLKEANKKANSIWNCKAIWKKMIGKPAQDIIICAENVNWAEKGAFTGEISIDMLKELKVNYSIIGHSERRQMFGETDETVNQKATALLKAGMTPILCCGEDEKTYTDGKTNTFVANQIKKGFKGISAKDAQNVIVAYEPIWAIGTGKTATPEIAQKVCAMIRDTLAKMYTKAVANKIVIQYGGSVKPANAKDILSQKDIDGALIGGASLVAKDFNALMNYNK